MDRIAEGYIAGVYYAVTVGESQKGEPDSIGVVSGAAAAHRLLEFHDRQPLPHSQPVLDVSNAESVVSALQELTHVIRVR
ncbi:hypothetical protein [Nonomuraea wenchangensis]|uniref:Uncharacterized protein n=1 Tax=Nonomuraea wenchangensis TaxID=568860 RepID=A0A1I0LPT6_9ACTN|nr:hypothetical protein [Nonomuraea wenchangensis]SEU43734.1 hypothetical protein SAMN05421811_12228 [Nonomuraea wenchangensis]